MDIYDTPKPKKFICCRCSLPAKRHDHLGGVGLCKDCDTNYVAKEAQEASKLVVENKPIPDRLMYLYKSKQLRLVN